MLAVVVVIALVVSAALVTSVREAKRLHRTVALLERRVVTLELDSAATAVIEPDPEPTQPRPRNVLVN